MGAHDTEPGLSPVYLTWMIRPGPGGCTIRLQIDEIDTADSLQEAEDIWLPVLEVLQRLVNPGSLPEGRHQGRSGSNNPERALVSHSGSGLMPPARPRWRPWLSPRPPNG
jgi:hypothetical protein